MKLFFTLLLSFLILFMLISVDDIYAVKSSTKICGFDLCNKITQSDAISVYKKFISTRDLVLHEIENQGFNVNQITFAPFDTNDPNLVTAYVYTDGELPKISKSESLSRSSFSVNQQSPCPLWETKLLEDSQQFGVRLGEMPEQPGNGEPEHDKNSNIITNPGNPVGPGIGNEPGIPGSGTDLGFGGNDPIRPIPKPSTNIDSISSQDLSNVGRGSVLQQSVNPILTETNAPKNKVPEMGKINHIKDEIKEAVKNMHTPNKGIQNPCGNANILGGSGLHLERGQTWTPVSPNSPIRYTPTTPIATISVRG